ncbi:helix-turn-helix domain-containing protein [Gandjariella thermophila]|nr:helix-turn-helix transcriptional regulator [Gandjariella thermophila]
MVVERKSTVRARELGAALRRAMNEAGFDNRTVARRLGWSDTKVSLMLSGERSTPVEDVSAVLAICGVKGEERKRLLRLCREAKQVGWWQRHGSHLPKELRTFIDHESAAVAIHSFQPQLVPGLLQTADYMRAVMRASATFPVDETEERVAARLARQAIFDRFRSPRFTYFVHEFALPLPVGGPEVMSDQLHHLLRMSVRPYVALRVIPAAAGAHAGACGAFQLLEFAETPPVVYLEHDTASLFLEETAELAAYLAILTSLDLTALDLPQSRKLISHVASEFGGTREEPDDSS